MKLTRIAKMCCNGEKCPSIFESDDGDFVFQGYELNADARRQIASGMGPNENAVVIPKEVVHEAAARLIESPSVTS